MQDRFYIDDTSEEVEYVSVVENILDRLKKNSFSEILPYSGFREVRTDVVRVTNENVESIVVEF